MKYNHNSFKLYFTTNYAFIDVYVRRLNSAAIAIIEFQLRSVDYMGDQLAIRLRSMRLSSDLFVLWTDRHGPLCARESTDGDLGDHGDQLDTDQRRYTPVVIFYLIMLFVGFIHRWLHLIVEDTERTVPSAGQIETTIPTYQCVQMPLIYLYFLFVFLMY